MASTQPTNQKVRLTKTQVDRIALPPHGQVFVRDSELMGFALRATPGAKSFVVEKRIEGRVKRLTLGRYPELTVEQARKEAQKLLGKIASGVNPIAERRAEQMRGVPLAQAFADFLHARKSLKPRTLYDYRRLMAVAFPDWQEKPVRDISKDMVARRHARLGERHGAAYANLAMRFLRALLNFAKAQYEDGFGHPLIAENPVARLTQTRAWYRVERRRTVIRPGQIPAWFAAVSALKQLGENPQGAVVADYLLLLLFTGLRRQEAARLRWDAVDLAAETMTILETKNREPLTLPLSPFVAMLLRERKAGSSGEYVFPGAGAGGYLVEPRNQIAKVIAASGVAFTLHDLRRTFITVAESLDISAYALKRLVNHKLSGDVTAGYIVSDVERLREPMRRIADHLLQLAGVKEPARIVVLPQKTSAV